MSDPQRSVEPASVPSSAVDLAASLSLGVQRQLEIHLRGQSGQRPIQSIAPEVLEERAREVLPPEAYVYVAGGAGCEDTIRANRDAFRRWRILPRLLRDVSRRDLRPAWAAAARSGAAGPGGCAVDAAMPKPSGRGPGRPLTRRADGSVSSTPLEEVAAALGDGPRWFQLYQPKDPALAASLVGRAERAGFEALVVTLDTYLLGWRERDLQLAWLPFAHGQGIANYLTDPIFRAALPAPPERDPAAAVRHFLAVVSNAA